MSRSKKKHGAVKWVVTALVIAAIAGGVVYAKTAGSSKIPDITCTSGKVMEQDLSQYITLSGTVSGKSSMTITGDPTLKVEKLNVRKGDAVKKGDVLCIFDSTSLQEEFDSLSDSNSRTQGAQNYTHGINQRNLENARRDKANALSKAQQDIDDAYNKRDQAYENYNNKVNQFNEINKNIDTVYADMRLITKKNSRQRKLSGRSLKQNPLSSIMNSLPSMKCFLPMTMPSLPQREHTRMWKNPLTISSRMLRIP